MFDPPSSILISEQSLSKRPFAAIAHEATHIGNFHLSNSISLSNKWRFLDEGLASVLEYRLVGKELGAKPYLNCQAKQHLNQWDIVSIQDWERSFDPRGERNYWTYSNAVKHFSMDKGATFRHSPVVA